MRCLGQNLYQETNGRFFGLFWINGRRTKRKLAAITPKAARAELDLKQSNHKLAALGLATDPFKVASTVAELAALWDKAGCPDHRRRPRAGAKLSACEAQLTRLVQFFGPQDAEKITVAACDRYHDWVITKVRRGAGHRTAEVELGILSNLLTWAARSEYIRFNPLAVGRPNYRDIAAVKHCTEHMPASDEELHALAEFLLDTEDSETLAWQLLLEALTGCRTSEILELRWDAPKLGPLGAPGHIDDTCLYVHRLKRGMFPYVLLDPFPPSTPDTQHSSDSALRTPHSALRTCLRALRHWHDQRYPSSPWFLPGHVRGQPVDAGSLTHALDRACQVLDLPHRSSHGLRAYHVRVLRSQGIDDSEIAKRLGHRSGVALVEKIYGVSEPGWFGSKKLDFLPEGNGRIAWAAWLPTEQPNIIPLQQTA